MRNPFRQFVRLAQRITPAFLGTITHVRTAEPAVALTFDDGPHPHFTPRLLEILAGRGARATFFMVGESAQRYGELVREVAVAGHAVANHSWDHASLPLVSGAERIDQITRCRDALAPYGAPIFRPPYGHQTLFSRIDAWRLGYTVVAWNVVAEDWLDHGAEQIADRVAQSLRPGSIVLFHDALYTMSDRVYADRSATLEAVDELLSRFAEKLRFVTVPELIEMGQPCMEGWYKRGDQNWLNRRVMEQGDARRY